jgi:cyclic pyranopterin phosphate synthase
VARRADLKTGTSCNSNCVFCVIGDHLFTGDRPTRDCLEELRASRATCDDVVFTGAEVTLREDFLQLVAAARRLGYRNIQIQTNGRRFAYKPFCEAAVAAGANEFSPSIHGHVARLHDGLTRSPGSFDQIVEAIRNLRALGQRVVTNTVATRQNARHLPSLARLLVELDVTQLQIAFPHPTGHAATYFDGVVPRMRELAPHVMAALAVGRDAGVPCLVEAMPFCQVPGWERHVAELHIPPTEIVYDGFVVPDYARDRMERGKTRFVQCSKCRFEPICEGPWREYPERVGSDEFQPVDGARVIDGAVVLDERFARLGAAAPRFAALDGATTPWIAVVFYPEAGAGACAVEARGLAAGREALGAAGVSVVELDLARDAAVAREYGARARSTYVLDGERRIAHVIVTPDVRRPVEQLLDAIARLTAPARPIERGPELVVIRRKPKSLPEQTRELGFSVEEFD